MDYTPCGALTVIGVACRLHARQTKLFTDFAQNAGEFKELFDSLDTNGDGTIDRTELAAGMVKRGFNWLLPLPFVANAARVVDQRLRVAHCACVLPWLRRSFGRMDLNHNDAITFDEFRTWLKREQKRRTGMAHMRQRTVQLMRKRSARKARVSKLMTALKSRQGSKAKLSLKERRVAIIRAAASMASHEDVALSSAEQRKQDKLLLSSLQWVSSTCFASPTKIAGENAALLVMKKLAALCKQGGGQPDSEDTGDPVMFEDPDFGPRQSKAGGAVTKQCVGDMNRAVGLASVPHRAVVLALTCRYDEWLQSMGVKPPTTFRDEPKDEFGTYSLYVCVVSSSPSSARLIGRAWSGVLQLRQGWSAQLPVPQPHRIGVAAPRGRGSTRQVREAAAVRRWRGLKRRSARPAGRLLAHRRDVPARHAR